MVLLGRQEFHGRGANGFLVVRVFPLPTVEAFNYCVAIRQASRAVAGDLEKEGDHGQLEYQATRQYPLWNGMDKT